MNGDDKENSSNTTKNSDTETFSLDDDEKFFSGFEISDGEADKKNQENSSELINLKDEEKYFRNLREKPPIKRENVRAYIAYILLFILFFEIALMLTLSILYGDLTNSIRETLSMVFGSTVALVGAATGFYYGGKTVSDRK